MTNKANISSLSKRKKKRVWLIRHGQSTFNAAMIAFFQNFPAEKIAEQADPARWWDNPSHYDPQTPDAPLTNLGVEQAKELSNMVEGLPIELICVSPLTRALETYSLAFRDRRTVPVVVCPLISERVNSSCDVGSSPSQIQMQFPSIALGCLEEDWWRQTASLKRGYPALDPPHVMEPMAVFRARIKTFEAWLRCRSEQNICLVCHAVVINAITNKWVANCELNVVEL